MSCLAGIVRLAVGGLLLLLLLDPVDAQSMHPQARTVYAMHAARINQIRPTPDLQRLVTVSQDKTIRVWRMKDLRLLRTIHIPSEPGEEGALRSLSITPDGREVIVGGWTGIAWSRKGQLYRFDLTTGRLLQTLRGFPSIVESLAFSHDGQRLAVGLGAEGLRVLEMPTGRELFADTEYAERVTFIDFAVTGWLATTSADGCLRLYNTQLHLKFRAEYPPRVEGGVCRGSELGGVRFSPDGSKLAFGLQDRVEMLVFDVERQALLQRLTVTDPAQSSLCCLHWSADGAQLIMNGGYSGDGPTPLYRVTLASGAVERLPVGRQRFTNILPLPDGDVVFSTDAPSLARVARDGQLVAEALPPNGDFRFGWERFLVDANAGRVALPMDSQGRDVRLFVINDDPQRSFRRSEPGDMTELAPPVRTGINVEARLDEFGYKQPVRVNGRLVALNPFQSVRSWATGDGRVVFGTQWSVLATDLQGQRRWEQNLPAPAYQVNISSNGRWVVAAIGDGSLRWYAADSGQEVLSAFLHVNGIDWIAWRPDGYYASSPSGDEYLGWLVNHGDTREPDFMRAVQFERTLYRPELVRASLRHENASGSTVDQRATADTLKRLAAPKVRIEAILEKTRQVSFSVESAGIAVQEIGVYAEGIPVLSAADRKISKGVQNFTRTITVPDGLPFDRIRVEAVSASAMGLDEVAAPQALPPPELGGRLWVLAIGVERFDNLDHCRTEGACGITVPALPHATNDAKALAASLQERYKGVFQSIQTKVLAQDGNARPTKAAIQSALGELQAANPEDTVIIFLASHGLAYAGVFQEYFFLPADAQLHALEHIAFQGKGSQQPASSNTSSLLSGSELNDALRYVRGRRILIIDTCHAATADASTNPYLLVKRSAAAQYAVLSASTGEERSWEHPNAAVQHSAFTDALVRGLEGAADNNGDGILILDEVFRFVGGEVKRNVGMINRMRARSIAPKPPVSQTPVLYASETLRRSRLTRAKAEMASK